MGNSGAACTLLDWDTEFFGRRIARANEDRLTGGRLECIDAWCQANRIDCLYFPATLDDRDTPHLAETHGFHLVEVRLIFERSLETWRSEGRGKNSPEISTRPAAPDDLVVFEEIAGDSYVNSRYYLDPHFTEAQWQAYYRCWIRNSLAGAADLALAAEVDGEVVGYITGVIDRENNEGVYELTGVKPAARRAGVGQELFRSGVDWFVDQGVPSIRLATQGRNVPTQRMVQRFGFLTRSCQLYYHKWYTE